MRLVIGLAALSLAGPAFAGGYGHGAHYGPAGGDYRESRREHEAYEAHGAYEEHGYYQAAPRVPRCDPRVGQGHPYACPPGWGEVRLHDGFFWDAGGVGPAWIADGGGGGGGGIVIAGSGAGAGAFAGAGGGARATASASASASAAISVRIRGGFRGGRRGGGHKGGGGCGC